MDFNNKILQFIIAFILASCCPAVVISIISYKMSGTFTFKMLEWIFWEIFIVSLMGSLMAYSHASRISSKKGKPISAITFGLILLSLNVTFLLMFRIHR